MKPVFALLLLASLNCYCQDAEPLSFSEVISTDTALKKTELYSRAKAWFAETYKSAQDVIQLDDRENGKIIGKGSMRYTNNSLSGDASSGWIRYTIIVQVKDGKYKYTLENFYHESLEPGYNFGKITTAQECPYKVSSTSQKWRNKIWQDMQTTVAGNYESLIESLKTYMRRKTQDSDW
jgi:hypothetical protein